MSIYGIFILILVSRLLTSYYERDAQVLAFVIVNGLRAQH